MTNLTPAQIEILTAVSQNSTPFISFSEDKATLREDVAQLMGEYGMQKVETGYRVIRYTESGVWETREEAVQYLTDIVQDDANFALGID